MAQIKETIGNVFTDHGGMIIDPHTAVGVCGADQTYPGFRGDKGRGESKSDRPGAGAGAVPVVCLACAHWAKFPDAVEESLAGKGKTRADLDAERPAAIVALDTAKKRVSYVDNSEVRGEGEVFRCR